ncbi:hypothetical protein SLS60_006837 [Paraconiothyrium brasiliense]|uniref:Rhodopsin domain-containing protein n=1 Tax=Paraconiothyrium brasiliense TaxID=300254 RepID=A0ABR3R7N9_9PLEO
MPAAIIIPPALVDAQPAIHPEGLARTTVIVSGFLGGLAVFLVALRLAVRGWLYRSGTKAFGLDDLFLLIALAPFLSACATAIQACYYGVGTRDADLTQLQMIKAAQYNTYWQLSYALSIPFCKIAIASALFRVTSRSLYRYILWAVIALSSIVLTIAILSLVLLCKPWPATWNPTLGTCGDRGIITALSYAASAVTIITDWTCAIVPYFVLKDLQLPTRVRYSLIGVLGLGAFASIAAIVRLPYFQYYSHTTDVLYYSANITIWSNVESGIGIIAASIPPLRRLFACLRSSIGSSGRSKGDSQQQLSGYDSGYGKGSQIKSSNRDKTNIQLQSLKFGGTSAAVSGGIYNAKDKEGWERMSDDEVNSYSSQKNIVKNTTVEVRSDRRD